MTWNITETLDCIERRFGKVQRELANASLQSASERLRFARYHFHTQRDLVQSFIDTQLKERLVMDLAWGSDDESRGEYFDFMDKVAANAVACVQSIHAFADLFANGIFYALNLNSLGKELQPHFVDVKACLERLGKVSAYAAVARNLSALTDSGAFKHVDGLSNQAKHSRVIRTQVNEDLTGTRDARLQIRFSSFQRKGVDYPEVEVSEVLAPAFELASKTLVDSGRELTRLLA
jgi:hypothetical protein